MSTSLLYVIFGSFISILAQFVFSVRKYEEDRWRSRISLYIDCINQLRDFGVEYWTEAAEGNGGIGKKKSLEVKILCTIEQMSGLYLTFEEKLCTSDRGKIEAKFIDLRASITGETFQSAEFQVNLNTAREVGLICGELYVLVTHGGDRAAKIFKSKYDLVRD